MRVLVAIVMCWLSGATNAQPTTRGKPTRGRACLAELPSKFEKLDLRARAAADAAYNKALARKRLTVWSGSVGTHEGTPSEPDELGFSEQQGGFSKSDGPLELVADKKGVVYRVQRVRIGTDKTPQFTLCGCGPRGKGTAERVSDSVVKLPDGTKFGGDVRIQYIDRTPQVFYSRTEPGGGPCKQVP